MHPDVFWRGHQIETFVGPDPVTGAFPFGSLPPHRL